MSYNDDDDDDDGVYSGGMSWREAVTTDVGETPRRPAGSWLSDVRGDVDSVVRR